MKIPLIAIFVLLVSIAVGQTKSEPTPLQTLTDKDREGKQACGDYFATQEQDGKQFIVFRTGNGLVEAALGTVTIKYGSVNPPTVQITDYNPSGSHNPEGIVPAFTMTKEQKGKAPCLDKIYVANP